MANAAAQVKQSETLGNALNYDNMTRAQMIAELKRRDQVGADITSYFNRQEEDKRGRQIAFHNFREAFHTALRSRIVFHEGNTAYIQGLKDAETLFDAAYPL